ncbi:MAG: glycogen synthase GlgA [Dehalococcoidia bacterium]|nr:glycogen synthase GlgA [Dehalococcoidia bacterium]
MHVAMASPEIAPFAKTGGLGDVLGSLPKALQRLGLRVSLIMPAYRSVLRSGFPLTDTGVRFTVPISNRQEPGSLLKGKMGGDIPVYLVRADRYFDRNYLYGTAKGDYSDNAERFTFFARAILEVLKLDPPSIVHAHDWQSALAIAFLETQHYLYPELCSAKTVLTVHNLGHQGIFWHLDWHLLNLDWSFFTPRYLEFHGKINFLKGGLVFADAITTVSPTYAEEVKTADQGFGLEGVFQERAASLTGILNGADRDIWSPETDPFIEKRYSLSDLSGKQACKADLQRCFCLPENPHVPLIGMVSRLTAQKGFDLLKETLGKLVSGGVQLALLGTGDSRYRKFLTKLCMQYPDNVGVRIAFDETLAHKIIAGADLFLMPSRYEPGGLTQIYSLRYGTIPIVRATGGLRDTIEEFDPETRRGTGFVFDRYDARDLLAAVELALGLFSQKEEWAALMRNAMQADFSWDQSARAYLDLYRNLLDANDAFRAGGLGRREQFHGSSSVREQKGEVI